MPSLRRLFLPLSLFLLASAGILVPLPLFLERPSTPVDLGELVTVEVPGAEPVAGQFLLTAVNLRRAAPLDLVVVLFDDDAQLLGVPQILAPGQGDEDFFDAQREVFSSTAEIAAGVGLQAAGYEVFAGDGVRVVSVVEGSPADGVLAEGDLVVEVDGEPVATGQELVAAVTDPEAGGRERTLTVRRGESEQQVSVTPRPLQGDAPQLGVRAETVGLRVELPSGVSVDAGRVGGPSAGLMVALTVFDLADKVDLAAGRRIAGTGSIEPGGNVLPIGGLAAKVAASARAGAEVFLVPGVQEAEAFAALPPGSEMQVMGVDTFREAVDVLTGDQTRPV